MTISSRLLLCAVLGLLPLSGCTMLRMGLPDDFAQRGTRLPVRGRGFDLAPLSVGAYDIADVARGWTVTDWWRRRGVSETSSREAYKFVLRENGARLLDVECLGAAKGEEVRSPFGGAAVQVNDQVTLTALLQGASSQPPWQLDLARVPDQKVFGRVLMAGTLTDGARTLQVQGVFSVAGSTREASHPTGYALTLDGRLVAGIETVNAGSVTLEPGLPDDVRAAVIATAGALYLFQEPGPGHR